MVTCAAYMELMYAIIVCVISQELSVGFAWFVAMQAGSKFAEPGVKPLQASPDDSAMQFLARTAAKDTSKLILNNMQALAKNVSYHACMHAYAQNQ